MPSITDLITSLEVEQKMIERDRERANTEIEHILAKATQEGRANLNADEDRQVKELLAKRDQAKKDLDGVKFKLETARAAGEDQAETDKALNQRTATGTTLPAYDHVARVGREERTYHKGNDRSGSQFLMDVTRQFLHNDLDSQHRLGRHMQEERVERGGKYVERAVGTGAFTGLTVPQYLTDLYAPAVANLRPFANVCRKHPLPESGMTINISRITTSSSAAIQASQNSAVSEQNMADTLLTENIQTCAGQQTISRQAIDRGTGIEETVMDDLFRRYATTLDNTLINQATTGLDAVASTQTYTDASPTSPKIYGQMVGAAASVESVLLQYAQPNIALMHSRRWYGLLSAVGPNWPMIMTPQQGVPVQASALNENQMYGVSVRGVMQNGLSVVVDNNIVTNLGAGTNQDRIYVVATDECHLWEDPSAPLLIRAEQPAAANLGVLLVLYGYFGYTFRRFTNAAVKIDGTGLTPPAYTGV